MSFETDEYSADDGEPVELYEFIGPGILSWRYTSSDVQHVLNGHIYTPIAISRGEMPGNGTSDAEALILTMPRVTPLALAYALGNAFRQLRFRLYQVQMLSGEYEKVWDSRIAGFEVDGRWVQFRSPSPLADALHAAAPAWQFQQQCNNVLYDERCRVLRSSFDLATHVSAINGYFVTVASVGGQADQWFRGGSIVRTVDGESNLIVGQVGAVLELSAPFRDVEAGNAVTLYAGCDHLVETCRDKFANVVNFVGDPLIPRADIFKINIRSFGG
jgi:uncharacterized phage protein (TIGR02218 family)